MQRKRFCNPHTVMFFLLFGVLVSGAWAGETGASSLDFLAADEAGKPVTIENWHGFISMERAVDGSWKLVPPPTIRSRRFPLGKFEGKDLDWAGYDLLILDISTQSSGTLTIVLAEYDDGQRENRMFKMALPDPGDRIISIRLANQPDGDLEYSGPTLDGSWNPDPESGVEMAFVNYPTGMIINGIRLEKISEVKEDN